MVEVDEELMRSLVAKAFGESAGEITSVTDANQGRGVFSRVLRVGLAPTTDGAGIPDSVVLKIPALGINGEVARRSGAYGREALAYRRLLPPSPIRSPTVYLVVHDDDGFAWFVMEDLGPQRAVDQLDGLDLDDGLRVTAELRRFHDFWSDPRKLGRLSVRHATPKALDQAGLRNGLAALGRNWAHVIDAEHRMVFEALVDRREALAAMFADASAPTLCHGDPRADNMVFEATGRPVLFDWQQIAIQLGEADLAWLAATSMDTELRRRADDALVLAYETSIDRYRLGFVLPGLAVLLLAQRELTDERSARFVGSSLQRIGSALLDLDVALL